MNITIASFAAFMLIVVLGYRLLSARFRNIWLFVACLGFLITWSWEFVGILLVLGTVNYILGGWIGEAKEGRKRILWIGIAFDVFTLLIFKYSDFYIPELTAFLARIGMEKGSGGIQLLMPIGLSFTTVQLISYLADIHNRIVLPEKRWLKFILYALYFPKLLSGPIERARVFLPKLDQPQPLSAESIARNFTLIVIGLTRKLLIADVLNALIPSAAFVQPLTYSAQMLLTWLLAYAFVIYNDFAGYTSIARGVSGFLGIELSSNFNTPYFSRSIAEFWERWHISLSNWLRDYIFFPLSRLLRKKFPRPDHIINFILPPLVTMLVSGMWHGLSFSLLLWGGLHGAYLIVERIPTLWAPKVLMDERPKWQQAVAALITFSLAVLAWLPFRMDLITAKRYFAGIIIPSHWFKPDFLWMSEVFKGHLPVSDVYGWNIPDPRIFLVLVPAILLDWAQYRHKDELIFLKWPRWVQAALLALVTLGLFLASFADSAAPFVYQGF
jgi:D-alanyl-lipoteichoic acid acyltransferase DltB (MBOAT superfamily)